MMAIESWKISNILQGLPTNDEGKITLCSSFFTQSIVKYSLVVRWMNLNYVCWCARILTCGIFWCHLNLP